MSTLISKIKQLLSLEDDISKSKFKFRVDESCVPHLVKYVPQSYIAEGAYGVVFQVCENSSGTCSEIQCGNSKIPQCKYVVKVLHPLLRLKDRDIENEVKLSREFGEARYGLPAVGPKVVYSFKCEGEVSYGDNEWYKTPLYFIIMEKMDLTIKKYKEICKENYEKNIHHIDRKINELFNNIKTRGYVYTDFHDNNIMINVSGCNIVDIKFIDFGILVPVEQNVNTGRFQVTEDDEDDDDDEEPQTMGRFQISEDDEDDEEPQTVGRFQITDDDEDDGQTQTVGRFQISDDDEDEDDENDQPQRIGRFQISEDEEPIKPRNKDKSISRLNRYVNTLSSIKEHSPYYY